MENFIVSIGKSVDSVDSSRLLRRQTGGLRMNVGALGEAGTRD
jgi:hypothetical protein